MGISDMSLGLPADIDADVSTIESKCETLDRICSTMMGRAHDADGHFHGAAGEFTDAVAWDLSSASTAELAKWEETSGALTYGAATLRMWAEDIGTYRSTREELQERWNTAKSSAQFRVDNPVLSNPADPLGGLAASWVTDQEAAEVEALEELRTQLLGEHSTAWDTLMDRAEQTEKDLRDGPSADSLERMIDAGHLGWRHIGLFPPDHPPPLSEEEGEEAAEELEEYLNDPEGYEGDIAEVLAMLTVVTAAGVNNQRNGGQPPSDHMDFLEAFYEGFEDTLVNVGGPRGVLGVVDYLDGNEDLDGEIAQGFLSSMGDGIMVLSDESLFGGWDRLPDSIQMAASGPQLVPGDMAMDAGHTFYGPNIWGQDISALNRLLGSASPDLNAGEDLSASLALSLGNAAEAQGGVGPWIEESDALGLIEVTGRNEDAMHAIFTGEYEHPFLHDENGGFQEHGAFEDNDDFIDKAITGLYSADWSDDGEAVRNMTDWIAEQADSDDPKEASRAEQGLVGLAGRLSGIEDELTATGHDVVEEVNGEEIAWKNVPFGHLNPEIADSLADIFEAHVEIFADDEVMNASGHVDEDFSTGWTLDGGPAIDLDDRTNFVELISGSPEGAVRAIEVADRYTMDSLAGYAGTIGEGGNPEQTPATRSGLLWNVVGTGVSEQVVSRVENHNDAVEGEGAARKIHTDFARDLTASFIPKSPVAEVYKYVWNNVEQAVVNQADDGKMEIPTDSVPPMELNRDVINIHLMGAAHDHGSLDVPAPPGGVLDEDGNFITDPEEWDLDLDNSDTRVLRDEEWDSVRNQVWPGSDTDKSVEQVSEDFYDSFQHASNLNANSVSDFGPEGSMGGGGD